MKFAPTVLVDGLTITPPGWMWVFAYAIRGCEWAICEMEKDTFKDKLRQYLKDKHCHHVRGAIRLHLKEVRRLRRLL